VRYRFFDGLEMLDTGSGPGQISDAGGGQPSYYAIGRKPYGPQCGA